jgi:hypothetical protein
MAVVAASPASPALASDELVVVVMLAGFGKHTLLRHTNGDLQSAVCSHDCPEVLSPGVELLLLPHATSKAPTASDSPPKDRTMRPLMFMVELPPFIQRST